MRDSVSGGQLLALPCLETDSAAVDGALEAVFAVPGARLLIQSDNGSNRTSVELTNLLSRHAVLHLRPPIRGSRYHDACEAGIGSLEERADPLALLADRAGAWNLDDAEGVRRGIPVDAALPRRDQASVDRVAVRRALEGLLLQFPRLRVSPPISTISAPDSP